MQTGIARNKAGAIMDTMTPEELLAKIATMCIVTSKTRSTATVGDLINAAVRCSPEYVAQVAIYARTTAQMKDTPVILLAHLLARKEPELFSEVAPHVLTDLGTIKKFVGVVRGGQLGIKSLGSAAKNYIRNFMMEMDPQFLFAQDYGTPSVKDLVALTHPRPAGSHIPYFAWTMGKTKEYPEFLREYQQFLEGELKERLPRYVPANLLMNHWHKLDDKQKDLVIAKSSWTQIRKNYNKFAAHNETLTNEKLLDVDANILRKDLDSLMTTWREIGFSDKFELALVKSIAYTPALPEDLKVQIFIDNSGSMARDNNLMKAGWLARYLSTPRTAIYTFNDVVEEAFNQEHLFSRSLRALLHIRGGTRVSSALEAISPETDLAIVLSDNETWVESHRGTSVRDEYAKLRADDKFKAKVVFWDLEFKPCVPVSDDLTLNMSGLNTQLINAVIQFTLNTTSLVDTIKNIKLR